MVIKHNIPAKNSLRNLGINNKATQKNLEKLSTGYKVNRAADDAAGLAISEKMRGQIRGLGMATTNAENATALIQTAEGGLNEVHAILHRMRELAVQSANGTYQDDVDREALDLEFQSMKSEIDRIAGSTHYNNIMLLNGSVGGVRFGSFDTTADLDTALGAVLNNLNGDCSLELESDFNHLADSTATLVVNEQGGFFLVIGDTTYEGKEDSDNYEFRDAENNLVATLIHDGTNALADPTRNNPFVLSNLTLGENGSAVNFEDMVDAMIGTLSSQLIFQIGANGSADQEVGLHVQNMTSGNLGLFDVAERTLFHTSVALRESAKDAIEIIDAATNQTSMVRAALGALQNRMEHTINNLGVTRENLQAAESSIRDTDMAKEMMEFTKNSILVQASQAMLAQANALPQGLLSLLQ